jgi:hypothetical protein
MGILSENCFGAVIREASPYIHGIPAGNPDTPCGRSVKAGYRFHHAIESKRIHLQPAEGVGSVHPKQASFRKRGHDRLGEAAMLLGLIGLRSYQGCKCVHGVEQPVDRLRVSYSHEVPPYLWAYEVR